MKHAAQDKRIKRIRRHHRVRSVVSGTAERPRLSVYRSNMAIIAQLVDDVSGTTVAQSRGEADKAGVDIAAQATKKGIKVVVFDRGGFKYHGRVKAFAEAARKAGLQF
ncbi:MAG: 50S ribosomal protein L18 [Parcubacteria group bacterium GW2011_GWA2_47_8]|nr:ribosomal protein L18 [uncultured bacterium]KKU82752.1 MAG: 50S ribosomal protein L18 [Parcubacteria group bacterium GW2011_GWA2_47_8]OHB20419.1 MAG: 50S ribosomal protein L18 [Parcubacteria group bacterium RIFCSPHIGHO2_01_FULL_47_10b]